ncbi:CapA family protein [Candidatus Leptofilum sp.]|uniref:CapA family protein n=1 Tax=Candidatus Leptofilum sp. TaxID=3241576 RepID=UPI003B5951AF
MRKIYPQISQIFRLGNQLICSEKATSYRLFFLALFFLIGCGQTAVSNQLLPTIAPTIAQPASTFPAPPTPIPATNTPRITQETPTLSEAETAVPTDIPPTSPPLAPLTLAVPEKWQPLVTTALAEAVTNRSWQIVPANEPADATLTENGPGQLVWQEPIVLAVPFVTEWETIGQAEAEAILANGHELAVVLPWSELTPDFKPLRVDGRLPTDTNYPFHNRLTLQSENHSANELLPILQTAVAPEAVVHLVSVGDIMLDRGLGIVLQNGNLAYPFANVAPLLQGADIAVGNVESALGDVGTPELKSYPFRAPPKAAEALALAGFDVVSLANNHGMDYGPEALLQAIDLLQAQGIVPIGAGSNIDAAHTPHITQINGVSLAFLGYVHVPVEVSGFDTAVWTATENTPGLAWADPTVIAADVTAVRPQADLVIVVLHSGYEYIEEPSPPQTAAARAAIDAGADLVIGHHAHILQGIEFYNGGVIVYGLGNFAFEIDGPPETAVLNVWLDANGVRSLELIPAIIQEGGQPRLAESWEAAPILRQVYFLTRILNSR